MALYKLKTWYPSLPKDWKPGLVVHNVDEYRKNMFYPKEIKYTTTGVHLRELKGNSAFWESIGEYGGVKIQQYITNGNVGRKHKPNSSIYSIDIPKNRISVKIKDKIIFNDDCEYIVDYIFVNSSKSISINCLDGTEKHNLYNIKQVIPYLFTTEDCVDIYEGDGWYYVVLDEPDKLPVYTKKCHNIKNSSVKRFHTLENALEFISYHLKTYTIHEICNVLRALSEYSEAQIKEFKEIFNLNRGN